MFFVAIELSPLFLPPRHLCSAAFGVGFFDTLALFLFRTSSVFLD